MRSTLADAGKATKTATGTINLDGAVLTWTGLRPIITKTGTGTYNLRLPGCKWIYAVSLMVLASPPWVIDGGSWDGADNFGVAIFNSTTAAASDIAWTYTVEYR